MITPIANKLTAFILVFILFAHNINTLVIIGDFMMNQAIIAKNICVQKDDQRGCNGKCHLRKQLSKSDSNSNKELPIQENKRISLDIYCMFSYSVFNKQIETYFLKKQNQLYKPSNVVKTYLEVETPPPVLS